MELLSGPLTEAVWAPDVPESSTITPVQPSMVRNNPFLNDFIESEDIVEFLSRKDVVYTEEVWGDMLGLLNQAQQETSTQSKETSTQSKENNRADSALERLRMLQRQLKSKL